MTRLGGRQRHAVGEVEHTETDLDRSAVAPRPMTSWAVHQLLAGGLQHRGPVVAWSALVGQWARPSSLFGGPPTAAQAAAGLVALCSKQIARRPSAPRRAKRKR